MKRRNCEEALRLGLDQEACHNFRAVRQWVMCSAWRKEEEGVPFSEAVSQAWDEAVELCRLAGGSPSPEEKPALQKVTRLLDPETGERIGKIVLADNELSICFGDDCVTSKVKDGLRAYYLAVTFYNEAGYPIEEEHRGRSPEGAG